MSETKNAPAGLDALSRLREIVAALRAPDGCPWDREQTHTTLRTHLIEEAHEVLEAIDNRDDGHLCEELGDLLLQVVLHCQIAAEEGRFDLDDVARGIAEKLVRRHPHVFGGDKLGTSEAVLVQWDKIKRQEKSGQESLLDGVSPALPALMRAEKIQKRAARVGFDWPETAPVLDKLREEISEIEAALQTKDTRAVEDEIGDLLFTVVNFARHLKIDAELAMRHATGKFEDRFKKLERIVKDRRKQMDKLSLAELDEIWNEVKARETSGNSL